MDIRRKNRESQKICEPQQRHDDCHCHRRPDLVIFLTNLNQRTLFRPIRILSHLLTIDPSTMMRTIVTLLFCAATAHAFAPLPQATRESTTALQVHRRDVLITGIMGLVAVPSLAHAKGSTWFFDETIENVREPSQMATDGRVDLNSAFVVRGFESVCLFVNGRERVDSLM
jgi:hypothetical protein